MRPVKLELQAFGPFVEKQSIDFKRLSKDGIFLIKGKTGSGKTTIFDAITVALYGGGSGDSKARNDFNEWRCKQADWETETLVSFTFEVKGVTYRFTRKLVPKVKQISQVLEAGIVHEDGTVTAFFNHPLEKTINKKAEEILGLTKDQFRQVVLLPQGQFERFLTASAGEKEEILEKIFEEDRWKNYADNLYAAAKARKDALDNEKKLMDGSLGEEGLASLEELSQKVDFLKEAQAAGLKTHEAFNGSKKQEELARDISIFEQFKDLHRLETRKKDLFSLRGEFEEKKKTYAEAEKAEKLRQDIADFENADKALKERENALKKKQEELPEKEEAVTLASEKKQRHEENSIVSEMQHKQAEYDAKRPAYEAYADLSEKSREAGEDYLKAGRVQEESQKALEKATENSGTLLKKYNESEITAAEYRNRYFNGIYGELAQELIPGEQCPVCGSTSHPMPAERTPDSVSKEQWDEKEKAKETAKKAWEKAEDYRKEKEKEKTEKYEAAQEKLRAKEKADAALESCRQLLIDGISDLQALNKAKTDCEKALRRYQEETEQLNKALEAAKEERDTLRTRIGEAENEKMTAEKNLSLAKSSLKAALQKAGYEDYLTVKGLLVSQEERAGMHKEIVAYDTSCQETDKALEEKKRVLEGVSEPEGDRFEARQKEIREENDLFQKRDGELTNDIKRLCEKHKNLSGKEKYYRDNIHQAESDYAFAKTVRGETGIGLQRYVLAIMFNKVLDEANRMLKSVHGGRYRLFRTDEKGQGNKRGLELKVYDSRTPGDMDGRPVGMLSGGEKFLVSLALSIGLSTVAQKTGVEIEALFIDEGFGTLDESSIHDALSVLEGVRKGCGTIGIISHVGLLESTIPNQLEVVKEDDRNWIRMV